MTVFNIIVYYDTICPWCYIRHKTLDRAVDLYKKTYPGGSSDNFVFIFWPYYLNPNDPADGIPWAQSVAMKNGENHVNAIRTRLQRFGRANGIEFSFGSKVGRTRDSHRLMQFAPPESRKVLLDEIFRAHFEHDADITSRADLTEMAVSAGLEESEVLDLLGSEKGGDEVDELAQQAKKMGVSGVPTVEINGQTIVGAEDVSEFYETFVRLKKRWGESQDN